LKGSRVKTYTFLRELGRGNFSRVYEAINDDHKDFVAIKVIQEKKMKENPALGEQVKREIKVLRVCNNENVIRFVDTFCASKRVFIITELCNGGNLEQYISKKKTLSEDEATVYLFQILNGFKGLHEVNAMHRDLKPANLLLHNGALKIADLGFSKQLEKGKAETKTSLGTIMTMAP
jgi:serine/threonine protein kinase